MSDPASAPVAPPSDLAALYAKMALIRAFETQVAALYRDGDIPGFVHTSLGQEAVASGVCAVLGAEDYMTTTHRGHGHVLAKGADVGGMMAELFGRTDGLNRGKGGSMHVADPAIGILGANAIVGAGIPLATGAALASKLLAQRRVAVAFFGEGAVNQGMFHEAVNLAAIWDLPVVLVCENNRYAEFSDSAKMTRISDVAERATGGYGIWACSVDGNDVAAVHEVAREAVARCRAGDGPALIEANTYRWHGHYEGDAQPYKPEAERAAWEARDPLLIAELELVNRGDASAADLAEIRRAAEDRVAEAVERARNAPLPAAEEAFEHVFVD